MVIKCARAARRDRYCAVSRSARPVGHISDSVPHRAGVLAILGGVCRSHCSARARPGSTLRARHEPFVVPFYALIAAPAAAVDRLPCWSLPGDQSGPPEPDRGAARRINGQPLLHGVHSRRNCSASLCLRLRYKPGTGARLPRRSSWSATVRSSHGASWQRSLAWPAARPPTWLPGCARPGWCPSVRRPCTARGRPMTSLHAHSDGPVVLALRPASCRLAPRLVRHRWRARAVGLGAAQRQGSRRDPRSAARDRGACGGPAGRACRGRGGGRAWPGRGDAAARRHHARLAGRRLGRSRGRATGRRGQRRDDGGRRHGTHAPDRRSAVASRAGGRDRRRARARRSPGPGRSRAGRGVRPYAVRRPQPGVPLRGSRLLGRSV